MYRYIILPHFYHQLKPYVKKHPDLKEAVITLLETFDSRRHESLGHSVYKARVRTTSLSKGKSGSFRLIIYLAQLSSIIIPITIYFKGDRATMTKREINDHLERILNEFKQMTF